MWLYHTNVSSVTNFQLDRIPIGHATEAWLLVLKDAAHALSPSHPLKEPPSPKEVVGAHQSRHNLSQLAFEVQICWLVPCLLLTVHTS